jgi:hypothetical protein
MRFDDSRWVQLGVTSISYGGRGRQPIATKPYLSPPGYTRQLAVRLCLCVCVSVAGLGWSHPEAKQAMAIGKVRKRHGQIAIRMQ